MELPQVFDQGGQEQDWDWLVENFGAVTIEQAEIAGEATHVYRVVKLQDAGGPAVQVVNVVDQEGHPIEGTRVVRHWPDAPPLPSWPPPASRWRNEGVFGRTNGEGNVGYGMGHGDYYFAPDNGVSAVWVADAAGPSDLVRGLGMLGGTDHRHLNIHYQLVDTEPGQPPSPPYPPPPPPPDRQWEALFAKLDLIIDMLEKRVGGPS